MEFGMQIFLSPVTALYMICFIMVNLSGTGYSHGRLTNMHSSSAVLFIS